MINKILEKIKQDKKPKILIIGDVMLDEQINGEVNRISPEAPIPVVLYKNKTYTTGGAANVAVNLLKMQTNVSLISVTGGDSSHNKLKNLLKNQVKAKFLIDDTRPTTTKTRIVSTGHQIVRVDTESTKNISTEYENALIKLFDFTIENEKPNIVVISDYGKGVATKTVCEHIIKTSKALNIPVLVDPKGKDYKKYSGCTVITPNKAELQLATEKKDTEEMIVAAQHLCAKFNIDNIALTRSEEGISLITANTHEHYPATAQEVVDVCGAGDAVISAIALALSLSLSISESVYLGNLAGGISVKKSGTYAVSKIDLLKECAENINSSFAAKCFSNMQLLEVVNVWKKNKEKIVFTNGCFDLFHVGHLSLLQSSKKLGTKLIVGLNSDSSIKTIKGQNRPIINENERVQILSALECVDAVVLFDETTPLTLIELITPDVLVKGGDYQAESIVGASHVVKNKGKVFTIDLIDGISTTKILEKINKKY